MSAVKIVSTLLGGLLVIFVASIFFLLTPIGATPLWVYATIIGILVSGYLTFKYAKDEKEIESRWIEQEGETFLEPIRERRQNKQIVNK